MELLTQTENRLIRCFPGFAIEVEPYDENALPKDLDVSQQFYSVDKYEFLALLISGLILNSSESSTIFSFYGSYELLREHLETWCAELVWKLTIEVDAYKYYSDIYKVELSNE